MFRINKQMQQWALVAIGGVVGSVVIIQFVVAPMIGSIKENREVIRTLRVELDAAREVIRTGATIQQNLVQTRADIRAMAANIPLPVLGNYLLDREQQIRDCCTGLNMQLDAVVEHDVLGMAGWNSLFNAYRVRVAGKAGINDLARCLIAIQQNNPLASVMMIDITPQESTPDTHRVSFVVAWLVWAQPDKRPAFLTASEQNAPAPASQP